MIVNRYLLYALFFPIHKQRKSIFLAYYWLSIHLCGLQPDSAPGRGAAFQLASLERAGQLVVWTVLDGEGSQEVELGGQAGQHRLCGASHGTEGRLHL